MMRGRGGLLRRPPLVAHDEAAATTSTIHHYHPVVSSPKHLHNNNKLHNSVPWKVLRSLSIIPRCSNDTNQRNTHPWTRCTWFNLFVIWILIGFTVGIIKLYQIYLAETNPSPFLPSPYNYLSHHIRGLEPPSHRFVFPTVPERIQFYMGHWYAPYNNNNKQPQYLHNNNNYNNNHHNSNDDDSLLRLLLSLCDSSSIEYWQPGMPEIGKPYRFNSTNLYQLIYQGWYKRLPWRPQRSHPGDAYLYHFQQLVNHHNHDDNDIHHPLLLHPDKKHNNQKNINSNKQMLLQFGDGKDSANFLSTPYPIMVKTRLATSVYQHRFNSSSSSSSSNSNNGKNNDSTLATTTTTIFTKKYPPILGMYEIHRHYNDHFYETDDLWEVIPWHIKHNTLIWRGSSSGKRRFVIQEYIDYHQPLYNIDIAFSEILKVHRNTFPKPDSYYVRQEMSIRQLLSYKYLLVLEGWGMASSLKWMLYSNSVVFMAEPTKTSWAMEEKLVPYVHYVPVWQNYSNLLPQLEWAQNHEEECQNIALYSRHYMERLVTSTQAQQETMEILSGMDKIYQQHYGKILSQQPCP